MLSAHCEKNHINNKKIALKNKVAVLITQEFEPLTKNGGVGTYFKELATQFKKNNWQVILVFAGPKTQSESHNLKHIDKVYCCESQKEKGNYSTSCQYTFEDNPSDPYQGKSYKCFCILKKIEKENRDCLIYAEFHEMCGLPYYSVQAKKTGNFKKQTILATTIHSGHEWIFTLNRSIFNYQARPFLRIATREENSFRNADLKIYPSNSLRKILVKWGWNLNGAVRLPYFIPHIKKINYLREPVSGIPIIIFFGRIEERKGIVEFISAINLVSKQHKRINLIFFGKSVILHEQCNSPLTSKEYCETNLASNVKWKIHDGLSSEEAIKKIQDIQNKIICLASPEDNFPNTALEAGQIDCPLVVSDNIGHREALKHVERKDGVLWFQPGNCEDLSKQITKALAYPKKEWFPKKLSNKVAKKNNILFKIRERKINRLICRKKQKKNSKPPSVFLCNSSSYKTYKLPPHNFYAFFDESVKLSYSQAKNAAIKMSLLGINLLVPCCEVIKSRKLCIPDAPNLLDILLGKVPKIFFLSQQAIKEIGKTKNKNLDFKTMKSLLFLKCFLNNIEYQFDISLRISVENNENEPEKISLHSFDLFYQMLTSARDKRKRLNFNISLALFQLLQKTIKVKPAKAISLLKKVFLFFK